MLSNSRIMDWSIQAYGRKSCGLHIDLFVYVIHEVKESAPFHVVVWSKLLVDIFVKGGFGAFLMIPKYPHLYVNDLNH